MNKKEKSDLVTSVLQHKNIMLLLVGVLMLSGVFSLITMPKNEFPEFTFPIGIVAAVYPGATAEEVEIQLTKPLEDFVFSFREVNKTRSYTQTYDGMTVAFVYLNDDVRDATTFWNKLKERISFFKLSLPRGVLAVVANDDFGDSAALLVTLESNDKTYRELHGYMEELKDSLRRIPNLANMVVYGEQNEQISIYVNRDQMTKYGMNAVSLYNTLSGHGNTLPSGELENEYTSVPIHVRSSMNTEFDVAKQIVYNDPDGNTIRLEDIAEVKREYPHLTRYIKNNGRKCLLLSVQMNNGGNIVDFGKKVKETLANFKETLPDDVTIYPITDQSHVVGKSVDDFLHELLIAIISVIIVVMLMLPLRVAGVAVCTIPITIFSSLAIFHAFGVELNTVTLAALIVTLGMIVDDAVVIIDCYLEKLAVGTPRFKAAVDSTREFFFSILTATLCISITFFPLVFTTTSMIHDFIIWFPVAVTIVLTVSLLVAVLVVPWLQYTFITKPLETSENKGKKDKKKRKTFLEHVQDGYNRFIDRCFGYKITTMVVGLVCIIIGVILFARIPRRLMPHAERNQLPVEITLPIGTPIEETEKVADSLRNMLCKDERVKNITVFYGMGSPRFQTTYAPQIGGTNFAQFIINTGGDKDTQGLLNDYAELYSDYFPNARVRFKELSYSDARYPVEVRIQGNNPDSIHIATDSVMRRLRQDPQVYLVHSSFEGNREALNVVMDRDESNRLGISKSLLSLNLATRFGPGFKISSVWEGDYPMNVVLKDVNAGTQDVTNLENAMVGGFLPMTNVPLRQMSDVKPEWNDGAIYRRSGLRCASVFAETARGHNMARVNNSIFKELKTLRLPEGISILAGGQKESDLRYGNQVYGGLSLSVVVIFFILLFHLKKLKLTFLMMYSLLYSLLGASLGLTLGGHELGLTGLLGLISLMGIIARNGIIMVDYAEELRTVGEGNGPMSAEQAILLASKRRMRPIFLTSAAASMGVVPMVIENSPMWGPMGVGIFFGTIFSMVFILTMIPVGYSLIMKNEDNNNQA